MDDKLTENVSGDKVVVIRENYGDIGMGGARRAEPKRCCLPPLDLFVGRQRELAKLMAALTAEQTGAVGVTQAVATHGYGGVGKSTLALAAAWKGARDDAQFPGGVFYLSAEAPSIRAELAGLAPYLPVPDLDDLEALARAVREHLTSSDKRSLLLIDNLDDPAQLDDPEWAPWLPGGACVRLFTTRAPSLGRGVRMFPLDRLSPDDGVALLAESRDDATGDDDARAIVEWCDGLAVALVVVGAYMALNPSLTWSAYHRALQDRGLPALDETETLAREGGPIDARYFRRAASVFDDLVAALPAPERAALQYAALLPPDGFPDAWLARLLADSDHCTVPVGVGHTLETACEAVVRSLETRRLLRRLDTGAPLVALHRLLQRRLVDEMSGARDTLLDDIVMVGEWAGELSLQAVTARELRWLPDAVLALADTLVSFGQDRAAASLANWAHIPLQQLGRYADTRLALSPFEALDESPLTAATLSNLAVTLRNLGDLEAARERMQRAIDIDEKHFEPDHPTLATRYSNLALILRDLGDLEAARERTQRAIDIKEKHFEPDHPMLAASYSNLALILQDLGDLEGARERTQRAIDIKEKHFEPDHPTLAISYSNLATILQDLGDLEGARERMQHAIDIEEKHFDPDHPTLAVSYSNLATILAGQNDRAGACRLLFRARHILARHFDDQHPHVRIVEHSIKALDCDCPTSS